MTSNLKKISITENSEESDEVTEIERKISTVKKPLEEKPILRKISLVEKVQMLSSKPPESPYGTPNSTPFVTPLTTPQSSPKSQRKISPVVGSDGVVMERKVSNHSYFYKGGFFSSGAEATSNLANTTSANNSEKMEAANATANNFEPKSAMAMRKRRPKPSNLREMNFWAPTSM